jgi:hypothetical protein
MAHSREKPSTSNSQATLSVRNLDEPTQLSRDGAFRVIRYFVAAVIAIPQLLLVGWPYDWFVSLCIAIVSFGAGALVEHMARRLAGRA